MQTTIKSGRGEATAYALPRERACGKPLAAALRSRTKKKAKQHVILALATLLEAQVSTELGTTPCRCVTAPLGAEERRRLFRHTKRRVQ